MRVTVGMIVEALAAGRTVESLLSDFPYFEEQDIREALAYAANLAQGGNFLSRVNARLLIDMNLTPRWVQELAGAGHEALHSSEVGGPGAYDTKTTRAIQALQDYASELAKGAIVGFDGRARSVTKLQNKIPAL